jgi:hypothetical protein
VYQCSVGGVLHSHFLRASQEEETETTSTMMFCCGAAILRRKATAQHSKSVTAAAAVLSDRYFGTTHLQRRHCRDSLSGDRRFGSRNASASATTSTTPSLQWRRSFFASATDHTTLLSTAEVHCLPDVKDSSKRQYVLAAQGMEAEKVKLVPYLHLARIWFDVEENTMFGAKVVNRTLGDAVDVCDRLVDAVLQDAKPEVKARSTLHGLSEWVLDSKNSSIEAILSSMDENEVKAVQMIARNAAAEENPNALYDAGKKGWEALATEFVSLGEGQEAALYMSKGGSLGAIEHHADTSAYANTAGGAMAIFSFSR